YLATLVSTTFPHTVAVSPRWFFASAAVRIAGFFSSARARGNKAIMHIVTISVFIIVVFQFHVEAGARKPTDSRKSTPANPCSILNPSKRSFDKASMPLLVSGRRQGPEKSNPRG